MMKSNIWIKLFVLLALSDCADKEADCPVTPEEFNKTSSVEAVLGRNTILPCLPKFTINVEDDIVEWNKDAVEIYTVDNGKPTVQHDQYKDRISIPTEQLKTRNASLHLSGVKENDKGEYCCCIKSNQKGRRCTSLTLVVIIEEQQGKEHQKNTEEKPSKSPEGIGTTPSPENGNKGGNIGQTVGLSVGVVVVLAVLVLGFLIWKKCQDQNPAEQGHGTEMTTLQQPQNQQRDDNTAGASEDDRHEGEPNPENPVEQEDDNEMENQEQQQSEPLLQNEGTPRQGKCLNSDDHTQSAGEGDRMLTPNDEPNSSHRD